MIRFFILTILIVFPFSFLQGQVWDTSITPEDSITEEEKALAAKHALLVDFSHTLHKLGDPSISSFGFSDYNHNSTPSLQKKPFLLNATIQPILSIGGKRWYIGKYIHTLQIIPSTTVRIFENDTSFNDHSFPVRTPSFIVRFNYLFSHEKLWNNSLRSKIWFGISMYHYSNGQDGYEFNLDSTVNTYNGNFSEIAVGEVMMGGMRKYTKPLLSSGSSLKHKGPRKIQLYSRDKLIYWKLVFETHPKISTTERFLEYNLYGRKRLNLQMGYLFNPLIRSVSYNKEKQKWRPLESSFHNKEIRRVVLNLSYILDGKYNTGSINHLKPIHLYDVSKRLNVDLTWYERIGTTNDYAVFMRVGYYGSDPYNIYFQESIFIARVGIAFGTFTMGERK